MRQNWRKRKRNKRLLFLIPLFLLIIAVIAFYVINKRPNSIKISHYDQGVILYDDLQITSAIFEFESEIEENPENIDAYIKLADIYILKEQPEEATVVLVNALKINPEDKFIISKLADLYYASGQFKESEDLNSFLFNTDNTNNRAILSLFKIYSLTKNSQAEIDLLTKLGPENNPQDLFLAKYIMYLANEKEIPTGIDPLINLLPDASKANILTKIVSSAKLLTQPENKLLGLSNITYDLIQGGYYEFALPFADRMISENKFFYKGYLYRGIIYSHANLLSESEADLNKSIQIKSDNINSYVLLYEIKAALGKITELPDLTLKINELFKDSDQNIIWELFKIIDKYKLTQESIPLIELYSTKLTNYQKELLYISLKDYFLTDNLPKAAEASNNLLLDIASLNNEQKAVVYSLQAYFSYKANYISQSNANLSKANELYKHSSFAHYIKGRILIESGMLDEGTIELKRAKELDFDKVLIFKIDDLLSEEQK